MATETPPSPKRPRDPSSGNKVSQRATTFDPVWPESQSMTTSCWPLRASYTPNTKLPAGARAPGGRELAPMALPQEALPGLTARALELLGVDEAPEAYIAVLREHISSEPVSSHGAAVSVRRVTERAQASTAAGADAERFRVLHGSLSERGVSELDRFTLLLQRLSEERALTELLRATAAPLAEQAAPSCRDSETDERSRGSVASRRAGGSSSLPSSSAASASASIAGSPRRAITHSDAGWLFARRPLCGRHLEPVASGEEGEEPPPVSALGSLPLDVQESSLVSDLLLVLCGFDGSRIRAQPAGARAGATGEAGGAGSGAVGLTGAPAVRFVLSDDAAGAPPADPSLLGLARRMLPAADQCANAQTPPPRPRTPCAGAFAFSPRHCRRHL
eukprot:scaffold26581_cov79-Isochrysis_galbana.AAC.1